MASGSDSRYGRRQTRRRAARIGRRAEKTLRQSLVTSLDRTGAIPGRAAGGHDQAGQGGRGDESNGAGSNSVDLRYSGGGVAAKSGPRVKEMQEGNERKLEEMRQTVDEKLQGTLEKRLGESFKFVSDRLEMVHPGLGEMQGLAAGVGDLKRIFGNVKVRGTFAEVQLGSVLDQMLTPDQWAKNVCVKEGSLERVEFAIRLPGSRDDASQCMWLPIDSKFPTEDYARLQSAAEAGDAPLCKRRRTRCCGRSELAAKDIHDKYVNPPTRPITPSCSWRPRDCMRRRCGNRNSSRKSCRSIGR